MQPSPEPPPGSAYEPHDVLPLEEASFDEPQPAGDPSETPPPSYVPEPVGEPDEEQEVDELPSPESIPVESVTPEAIEPVDEYAPLPPEEPLPPLESPAEPQPEPNEVGSGASPMPELEPARAPTTLSAPPPLPPLPAPPRPRGASERSSRGGVSLSRLAALVALVAVVVAVALLAHSLLGSKKEKPVAAPVVVKVLIPEGKTRAQIAEVAKAAGLKGSYRAAAKSSGLLNPAHYGAPKDTPDLEGFLFPATYELDRGSSASQLVHEQLIAFQENFSSEYFRRAKELHVSAYGLLIVASMVEREAQVPSDRAKIAAVIYNRLADGMPLGIDASIYYAVEEEKHIATYTHELTESELRIDSPYNTRLHTGLPPTPISNPGVASIKAAAHPAHVAYLYYVAAANGCGGQVFSDTLAEFEVNAAAYEAAVKRNGGHPPSCKHH